eukprot:GHRR01030325.1.p1 GENE.GHRR01030325.1~~GHRR01030325.1.p1  ORF type:complete len:267 (+),score=97.53 GHRR01030325.1:878-1678(+)
MADFRKKFHTQLKQELADQGSSVTEPQLELMLLLATGTCTAPLQSFLGSTLSEAGLRRLARGLDSTAGGVHTALLERVMPLAELVLFLLGELRGCVACAAAAAGHQATAAEGSCWMGLKVELLQQLQLHAAALLLRCEQLRRCVTNAACQYRAFFTWLLKVVRQLEGQREDGDDNNDAGTPLPVGLAVTSFLKEQFMHDLIGAELSVRFAGSIQQCWLILHKSPLHVSDMANDMCNYHAQMPMLCLINYDYCQYHLPATAADTCVF